MNPLALLLLVSGVGILPVALIDWDFNAIDLIGVLCIAGSLAVQSLWPVRRAA